MLNLNRVYRTAETTANKNKLRLRPRIGNSRKGKKMISSLVDTLKKTVTFKGRATKADFWIFMLAVFLFTIVAALLIGLTAGSVLGKILFAIFAIIYLAIFVCYISVSVRRLHDLGLSGFWLWYLNPFGLPVIYMVYLLDLDQASNRLIGKIQGIGSVWLGWILTWLFWPIGASITLFLLFLYDGKKEDNEFGPNPYKKA